MQALEGFKTFILAVVTTLLGGALAGGFITPELGAEVDQTVRETIRATEQVVGGVNALIGALTIWARSVAKTGLFGKK